jgi:hypothetical protein
MFKGSVVRVVAGVGEVDVVFMCKKEGAGAPAQHIASVVPACKGGSVKKSIIGCGLDLVPGPPNPLHFD